MSRIFTKFAAALVLVAGLVGTSHAQEGTMTNENDIIRPITRQGSAAFLFTLQGLGTFGLGAPSIGSTSMAGAGMKWYFSDNVALRLLLALSNNSNKTGGSSSVTATETDFGLGAGVEYHFRPLYSTSPYIGGQISFTSGSTDNGLSNNAQIKTSSTTFGVNLFAGFDWFWTRGIAAGAEYGLGFGSTSGTTTTNGTSVDNPSVTSIGINGAGNVHLVVYF